MSTLKGALLVLAIIGCASAAHADKAAGESCAAQLTADGKAIYAATMATAPTIATIADSVERETRALVDAKKIAWDVARDNGVAAALCIRAALD